MTGSEGLMRVRQHHASGAVVLSVRGVDRPATVAEIEGVTDDVPVVLANGNAHSGSFNGAALGLLGFSDATGRGPSSPLFAAGSRRT